MDEQFIFNGRMLPPNSLIAGAKSPGLLYGEGIFETMRVHHQQIINEILHFDRLKLGSAILNFSVSDYFIEKLTEGIQQITKLYPSEKYLRVRLSLFRNTAKDPDSQPDYLITGIPVSAPVFNSSGLKTIIYPYGFKGTGIISNLKSNNYLLHSNALRFANKHGVQEAIVLNSFERVCETSLANIFFVEGEKIFTPLLTEGCVSGTIRKRLLSEYSIHGIPIRETTCDIDRLIHADEIFITNAIRRVEPVTSINGRGYHTRFARMIFDFLEKELR